MSHLNLSIGLVDTDGIGGLVPADPLNASRMPSNVRSSEAQIVREALSIGVVNGADLSRDGVVERHRAGRDVAYVIEE